MPKIAIAINSDFETIRPNHFFSTPAEKTMFNWFSFELAAEIDKAVPDALKRTLSKKGYTKQSFNRSCVQLAKLLQTNILRKLNNQAAQMEFSYVEIERAFPGLDDKTVNKLLDRTSQAWEHLLDRCVSCPNACVTNRTRHCPMFDEPMYYEE